PRRWARPLPPARARHRDRAAARLMRSWLGEPRGREGLEADGRGPAGDEIGHDLRRDRRQEDAVAEVAGGVDEAGDLRVRAEDGEAVRRSRPQAGPRLDDRRLGEV